MSLNKSHEVSALVLQTPSKGFNFRIVQTGSGTIQTPTISAQLNFFLLLASTLTVLTATALTGAFIGCQISNPSNLSSLILALTQGIETSCINLPWDKLFSSIPLWKLFSSFSFAYNLIVNGVNSGIRVDSYFIPFTPIFGE